MNDTDLIELIAKPRTRPDDPVRYGLGWAIGPSGQLYLNGRLPGYRAVILAIPDRKFAACGLANDSAALPALADWVSRAQSPLTRDELAGAINAFAA